jgi:hypothetical protein
MVRAVPILRDHGGCTVNGKRPPAKLLFACLPE